ncbi:hypothetical protein O3M35_010623 [Rhynocoris fuscipes]|uniref:C2H2-type domain-containing protein n=1 Tax=Rhynocoris fuscipes TaxID=488301 RepID=A0AAW1D2E1_9HEMI
MALKRELLYQEVKKQRTKFSLDQLSTVVNRNKHRKTYRRISKKLGLTKIKMEDCLRCDACSCIYIDPADYYKHMKNFHEKYNTLIPG